MDKTYFLVLIVFIVTLNVLPVIVESKTCWDKTWYNNSSPTNRSEYENVSTKLLATICSTGPVIDAQCKDNRGEPFRVHKIDKFNEYEATCDVTNGLICNPFVNTTKPCPDFAIQYGCACGVSRKGTSAVSAGNTASTGTSNPSGSGGNTTPSGTSNPSGSGGNTTPSGTSNPSGSGGNTTPLGTSNPSGSGGNTTPSGTSNPSGSGGNTTPSGTSNPSGSGGNTTPSGTSNPSGSGGNNSRLHKGHNGNGANREYVCSLMLLLLCLMLSCI